MPHASDNINIYLEIGKKRTFAGVIDWPGWCRSGRNEATALQALVDYAPRYARVIETAELGFRPPADASAFTIVERLAGNMTTDFGAPDIAPAHDARPVDDAELLRFQTLLRACWRAFDAAIQAATGKQLSTGPRGGGRQLEASIQHVLMAESGYLSRLARRHKVETDDQSVELERERQAVLDALAKAVHDGLPERGPRGGAIWQPRYFVRRVAWHVLDHVWEIEERAGIKE